MWCAEEPDREQIIITSPPDRKSCCPREVPGSDSADAAADARRNRDFLQTGSLEKRSLASASCQRREGNNEGEEERFQTREVNVSPLNCLRVLCVNFTGRSGRSGGIFHPTGDFHTEHTT